MVKPVWRTPGHVVCGNFRKENEDLTCVCSTLSAKKRAYTKPKSFRGKTELTHIFTHKSPNVHAVCKRWTLKFCTRVLCVHPGAWPPVGFILIYFSVENVWSKVGPFRAFLGIFTVVKIPRDSTGYGIIPWSRCNKKFPFPSKLAPWKCSLSRSRPRANVDVPFPVQTRPAKIRLRVWLTEWSLRRTVVRTENPEKSINREGSPARELSAECVVYL